MTEEATPQGASAEKKELHGPQPDLTRLNQLEEMASKIDQGRKEDIESLLETDPGFKAREQELEKERGIEQEGLSHLEPRHPRPE